MHACTLARVREYRWSEPARGNGHPSGEPRSLGKGLGRHAGESRLRRAALRRGLPSFVLLP